MGAPVPDDVKELIVCEDGDNKNQGAVRRTLMHRIAHPTRVGRVIKLASPAPGMDFNDMLMAEAGRGT